jgi:hypothetical protein
MQRFTLTASGAAHTQAADDCLRGAALLWTRPHGGHVPAFPDDDGTRSGEKKAQVM